MKEYFQYVVDNYLKYVRITKEAYTQSLFIIAFIVGILVFMPEKFFPIFNRAFETSLVILIALAIIAFLAFVALFLYKTYDDYSSEKLEKSPYDEVYSDTDKE